MLARTSTPPRAPRPALGLLAVACLTALLCALFAGCGLDPFGTAEKPAQKACSDAAQCGDGNPCVTWECAKGFCKIKDTLAGDIELQIAGDCKTDRCVDGAVVTENNDADVSDDGNDCTADTCVDGEPFNTAVPDGTVCFEGQAQGLCGNGTCGVVCGAGLPECDDSNPCTTDACEVATGQCAYEPLHAVPVPGMTEPVGDCGLTLCVAGQSEKVIDDTDLNVTPTDCDLEQCNGGVPANPPRPAGTACNTAGGRVCDGMGACVECNSPTDCVNLPPDDECQQRTCVNHVCGQMYTTAGTAISMQTAGDCREVQCDGTGGTTSTVDDNDILNDNKECTDNGCNNGTPTIVLHPVNSACGVMMDLYCNINGDCVGCTVDTQCSGSTDCQTAFCDANQVCDFTYAPAGTALPNQIPGDCKEDRCDGNGGVVSANISDPPVDGNPCTDDICTNGVPSNPPTLIDTPCTQAGGAAGYCDGMNLCVECNFPTQCPGQTACIDATCNGNTCGTMNVPAGTPLTDPTAGDCMRPECDGNGTAVVVPFDMDLPSDGIDCTADSCNNGTPTFTNEPAGTACTQNGGQECDGLGVCKKIPGTGCLAGTECLSTYCVDGVCCNMLCDQACQACDVAGSVGICSNAADGQQDLCNAGSQCSAGTCYKINGQICGLGTECLSGFCTDGVCCNAVCTAACQACNIAGNEGNCVNAGDGTQDLCAAGELCSAGTCLKVDGQTCAASAECLNGNCVDGYCCNSVCNAPCEACNLAGNEGSCLTDPALEGTQDTCAAGSVCTSGTCLQSNGQTCTVGTECVTGNCVDGYCCDTTCTGPCQACSVPGMVGSCSADPSLDGTQDSCAGGSVCSNGTCLKNNGQTCTVGTECLSGNCVDGYCCNSSCTGACQACSVPGNEGSCVTDPSLEGTQDTCAAGSVCTSGTCLKSNGQVCTVGTECVSGNCIDGYCCNTTCTGSCQACSVSGSEGSCVADPSLDGTQDSCVAGSVCSNGACLKSNGQTCALGTECVSGNCVDGVCCGTANCGTCQACNLNGMGTCAAVAAGDPDDSCTPTQICTAGGQCKSINGETCPNGNACYSGNCIDGRCCDTTCTGACQACDVVGSEGTCSADPSLNGMQDTCVAGSVCDNGICLKSNGQSCAVGIECVSGNCVDSFCCDTTCTGSCQACSVPGSVGSCVADPSLDGTQDSCVAGSVCSNGTCLKSNGQTCAVGTECASSNCVDGVCCGSSACGTCEACDINGMGTCAPVLSAPDDTCSGTQICDPAGQCKLVNGEACGIDDTLCASGSCVDGVCCGSSACGTCEACNIGVMGTCAAVPPGSPDDSCAANQICDAAGQCKLINGQACPGGATDCNSGFCVDTVCCESACNGPCEACDLSGTGTCDPDPSLDGTQDTCAAGSVCSNGTCLKSNGQSCGAGTECLSTFCVDSICCGSSACGLCEACDVGGMEGTCTPVANGTPDDSCAPNEVCDGGQCQLPNGETCSTGGECVSGNCVDGVCCGSAMCGTCEACDVGVMGACLPVAAGDPDDTCAANEVCDATAACKLIGGETCSVGTECYSTFCTDGVCCGAGTCGTCQACNILGSEGTCAQVPAGSPDDDSCNPGTEACNAAGQCKRANGQGCSAASQCASSFCTDGFCCGTSCADATDPCQACNVGGLEGTCSPDSTLDGLQDTCPGGQTCNAGACQ